MEFCYCPAKVAASLLPGAGGIRSLSTTTHSLHGIQTVSTGPGGVARSISR